MKTMKGMILGILLEVLLPGTCSSSGGNNATNGNHTGSIKDTGKSLFTLVKSVQVTPSGNYLNGGFPRIAYVPGRDRIIVTFNTKLSQPQADCIDVGYAYKEYTADMAETGSAGVVSCHALIDTGGLFVGNDFYFAGAERKDNVEGWNVAKFNAVTWASSVDYFYPFTDSQAGGGDPMVAYVNGQIDISGAYGDNATHHNFFTTDLQFVNKRLLSDTPHFGFTSMITQGGVINFLSSQGALGDLIVMRYDPSWTYLGVKTLKEHAATPTGVAFDGSRFYVVYTDASQRTTGCHCENVHLAAFDASWNLVDDIALTSLTLQDQMSAIHPSLAMKDNRLYVAYEQNAAGGGLDTLQVYVKVFSVNPPPPAGAWLTTSAIPGFRFKVRLTAGANVIATRMESDCVPETLCISAAVPGRSELFVRIVGPKPNGYLWPNLVKFTTSRLEVWIEQTETSEIQYYQLPQVSADSGILDGLFDKLGFLP
jgi:hypothetical protein